MQTRDTGETPVLRRTVPLACRERVERPVPIHEEGKGANFSPEFGINDLAQVCVGDE